MGNYYFLKKAKNLTFFLLTLLLSFNTYSQCTNGSNTFTWDGAGTGNQAIMLRTQTSISSTVTGCSAGDITVGVQIVDTDNVFYSNNIDGASFSGTNGNFGQPGYTLWFDGNNDLFDGNTANLIPLGDEMTFVFTFSQPIILTNFVIKDIDYQDAGNAGRWKDQVEMTATNGGVNVPLTAAKVNAASAMDIVGQMVTASTTDGAMDVVNTLGHATWSSTNVLNELRVTYKAGINNTAQQVIQMSNFTFCCPATITATNDNFSSTTIFPAGGSPGNVLTNDDYNGGTPVDADVDITVTNNGGLSGVSIDSDGDIIVPADTDAGNYTVTYQICETGATTLCDTATVLISVSCDTDGDGVCDDVDVCNGFDDSADNDGDLIPDGCDLDDDNDGILDIVECPFGTTIGDKSGAWTASGSGASTQWSSSAGTIGITLTATNYGTGTGNALNDFEGGLNTLLCDVPTNAFDDFTVKNSESLSIRNTFAAGTGSGVLTFVFSSAVTNPIINLDRLGGGGGVGTTTTASLLTLQTTGATFERLSGNDDHFVVTTTTITRTAGVVYTASDAECNTALLGTAGGSVKINGTFTTLTILVSENPDGNGDVNDRFELSFSDVKTTLCQDTDNDGIPDYKDTDSDNDGCPDAVEANGSFVVSQLTALVGGSNGAGSSLLNFGTTVDTAAGSTTFGVPIQDANNAAVTLPQTTRSVVTDENVNACNTDLSLTKSIDKAIIKVGDTIIYTLTIKNDGLSPATGVQVTDALPSGVTYSLHTVSTTGTTFTDSDSDSIRDLWTIGSMAVNQTISLQITATVSGTGTIINRAETTQSTQTDLDSIPNNGK